MANGQTSVKGASDLDSHDDKNCQPYLTDINKNFLPQFALEKKYWFDKVEIQFKRQKKTVWQMESNLIWVKLPFRLIRLMTDKRRVKNNSKIRSRH